MLVFCLILRTYYMNEPYLKGLKFSDTEHVDRIIKKTYIFNLFQANVPFLYPRKMFQRKH